MSSATHHDVSPPLRDLVPLRETSTPAPDSPVRQVSPQRPIPEGRIEAILNSGYGPPVIPNPTGPAEGKQMPGLLGSFEGINNRNGVYPPDTVGDVGPNHYIQMVNLSFQIWNKNGVSLYGPANNNTLWAGFGGQCQDRNDGDPIVLYDQFADRWLMSQFTADTSGTTFYECVAVSTTADPTDPWYRYSFSYNGLPDYPKLGVWPDGYYVSYNMFTPPTFGFTGAKVCSLDRTKMLAGNPTASQVCFDLPQEWSLLPSDADGPTPPPTGSPNYFVGEHWDDQDKLTMYKFHVDWTTPGNSTLVGPTNLQVNPFTWACLGVDRGRCVPQPGTAQRLESLGGRTMYRLAYRNFGDHESLMTNHTVAMDGNIGLTSQTGIAWYEIRQPNATKPVVYQDGTTADPDGSTFRWMGSMAMDKQGNMALGYSTSNASAGANSFPSIRFVGRKIWDPLDQMPQAESTIVTGTGVQTGSAGRWGDYSSMNVDPVDDCTFWYTNEYIQTTGTATWQTRIAKFKFPGCDGAKPSAPASVSAAPGNGSADVAFAAATSAPDLPVWKYTVTASPGGATCTTTPGVDPDPLKCTVTGLTNGQPYTFTVKARSDAGDGAPSAPSGPVTPRTVPGAPIGVTAAPGAPGSATVSWQPPAANGGAAITSYTATAAPGGATCTTGGTSCTIAGMNPGGTYTFTVVATNIAGDGPPSAASPPVDLSKLAQTAKVKVPKKIKPQGKTVLLKKAVKTNAGKKAKAKVKVKPKGKKYAKVKITKKGKVTIKTFGKKKLKVTLKLTAPATAQYNAYSYTKKWKVKKA
ncbi:MAG: fibronectin type III domain-containing protein [Candidatus Nanopelagicales bacterium]